MDKAKDFEKGWEEYKAKRQQEIEEMEKDIVRSAGLDVHGKAKYLYDLGYRKIPENAVVLTREEYKEILDREYDLKRWALESGAKTAEKFAERLKFKLEKHTRKIMREDYQQGAYIYMVESSDIETCIDEIAKEFTGDKNAKNVKQRKSNINDKI